MSILYAFDSMSVLYRGYFAMIRNPLINSKGINTSGIRTVLMQLVKIIEDVRPQYLAVASDVVDGRKSEKRVRFILTYVNRCSIIAYGQSK